MNNLDVQEFDEYLSQLYQSNTKPNHVIIHPKIWNGYWGIKKIPYSIRLVFRYLGKVFKNKYLFWVGMPLYWVRGLKEYV